MTQGTIGVPVRREVTVKAPVERAFAVFTEGMAGWWPHDTYHVGPTPAEAVMEPLQGGRCFSRTPDGTESDWGRVLVWEPPHRVVLAWLLTPAWAFEPDPARASEVEVRFTTEAPGHTRVELEHRGFDRYASGGEEMRAVVDGAGGWGVLMDRFRGAADDAGAAS